MIGRRVFLSVRPRAPIPFTPTAMSVRLASTLLLFAALAPRVGAQNVTPASLQALAVPPADTALTLHVGDRDLVAELRVPKGAGPHPLAIIIHGGCWMTKFADAKYMRPMAEAVRQAGIATWTISYRRADETGGGWPGTFLDVAAQTALVRTLAPRYKLDLTQVIASGHSAGAHLALWLAAQPKLPRSNAAHVSANALPIHAVVALDGPGDLVAANAGITQICGGGVLEQLLASKPAEAPERWRDASPSAWLPLGVPQVMVRGGLDARMAAGPSATGAMTVYAQRARAAGDSTWIVIADSTSHFAMLDPARPVFAVVVQAMRDALAAMKKPTRSPTLPSRAVVSRVADSLARVFLGAHSAPSVAVAVVRGRDTLVMRAWGKADLEQDVDATASTVYRVGSVTKQFTAAAVMQLVEQGRAKLDDPVGGYLPTLPAAWHVVTVRQLLNHTSGIPSYTDNGPSWVRRWGEAMPPDTLVALTANAPMWFAPGTKWQYDNSGYVVLGMLIEKLTGHTWADEIETRFAKPLGLAHTGNCMPMPLIKRRAHGYVRDENAWLNAPYIDMTQPYAAGAICSTIGDLTRWNSALHTGHVVTPASYALMTTPEGAAANAELKYGFGLGRDTLAGRPVVTHGGAIHGFLAGNAWIPSAQLSITVLANASGAPSDELLAQLARLALGVPLMTASKK